MSKMISPALPEGGVKEIGGHSLAVTLLVYTKDIPSDPTVRQQFLESKLQELGQEFTAGLERWEARCV